jgi:hypothetical protein
MEYEGIRTSAYQIFSDLSAKRFRALAKSKHRADLSMAATVEALRLRARLANSASLGPANGSTAGRH